MKIWLLTVGEPLPIDSGSQRLLRTGLFARHLADKGHEVDWWTSSFDHALKKPRYHSSTTVPMAPNYRLHALYGRDYRKNVSFARFLNHKEVAREFRRLADARTSPDVIVAAMPTIELAEAATVYGSKHAVPVVLDMRDLWPDIFVEVAPSVLKAPVWLMSRRSDARLKACVQKADAVWGITPEFVEWGLGKAGRPAREGDASFWLGLSSELPSEDKVLAAQASWEAKGIRESDGFINLCFFGVMSNKLDMETVIDAAKRIEKSHPKVRFVLCGTGDHLADYRALAKGLANVVFPGWVNAPEIRCLMHRSVAALAPYRSRRDFMISIPTKAIEYLSAGLPLLSSLRGSLERLVSETRTGLSYANGDAAGLASAIRTLVEDRALRDEFALNARRTFEQSFVGEGINDAMRSCLHTVRYEYEKRTQASLRAGSTILTPSR